MFYSVDHQNNASIAFAMSKHLGLDTIYQLFWQVYMDFVFSHLAEKGRPGTI